MWRACVNAANRALINRKTVPNHTARMQCILFYTAGYRNISLIWQPLPLPATPCCCSHVMVTPSLSIVAVAGTVNVRGCIGKRGREEGMSSVALLSSSLFTAQHTVLSAAVLKKT